MSPRFPSPPSAMTASGPSLNGAPTTINSGDMAGILAIAIQALEKQNREIKAENADLKARLDRLEKLIKERPYLTTAAAPVP